MAGTVTLAVGVLLWCACAWLLTRTSVPPLSLGGLDAHRYFTSAALRRTAQYARGEEILWLVATASMLIALLVLAWRLPRIVRGMKRGRVVRAIFVAVVLVVTLWFVGLPFSLADLWWQHHWGLGPFDVLAWLEAQWALAPRAIAVVVAIVLLVVLAGRFRQRWWLVATPVLVAIAALYAFGSTYLPGGSSHPLRNPGLRADAVRLERIEHVSGTPVGVEDVSSWTDQANAFTDGFGPSSRVTVWNTLVDGRFSRGEVDVVLAHEFGHVRSRHVLKALGWAALVMGPTLWLLAFATRRRGGLGEPANVPFAVLLLAVLSLAAAPFVNAVSRRYEAEADWRALAATRDPTSARKLFQAFERTSLEQPSPGLLDYLWLENHPTVLQRIAMANRWQERHR
jgi:STE24 endopeptidase